jgi:hypothetical protein
MQPFRAGHLSSSCARRGRVFTCRERTRYRPKAQEPARLPKPFCVNAESKIRWLVLQPFRIRPAQNSQVRMNTGFTRDRPHVRMPELVGKKLATVGCVWQYSGCTTLCTRWPSGIHRWYPELIINRLHRCLIKSLRTAPPTRTLVARPADRDCLRPHTEHTMFSYERSNAFAANHARLVGSA